MPTYEYKCENCGPFDHVQSMTEEALDACPDCEGSVKRLISKNVLITFKGSGFYANDSKAKPAEATPVKMETPKTAPEVAAST